MTTEIAVLQAEADALRRMILDAVRALIERHPDLIVRIDGVAYKSVAGGPIDLRLRVDVGVTGR